MKKLRPPVKTHGGKYFLAQWVVEHFPENYEEYVYCELCCGGGSVFLNKEKSQQEVINDLDRGVIGIFKSLRDEPEEFIDRLSQLPYTEETFLEAVERAKDPFDDYLELGINEYVLRRMSRGGMKKAFAWSNRLRGGQPGDLNAWETMLTQLPILAKRVRDTIIIHGHFQQALNVWDEENTLVYLDPPYLPATRSKNATDVYDNEMSVEDHIALLTSVRDARSKVILSGYSSSLYNKYLKGWRSVKKEIVNHASQQKSKEKRTEVLWMNY